MTRAYLVLVVGVLLGGCDVEVLPRKDDSDAPGKRSGMTVLRDNLTGCEYLATMSGLTPRLDADGKQICRARAAGGE